MFKLIINLVIAIAFSLTMQGQKNITGIWQQDEGSNYYTVILNNNEKCFYKFFIFTAKCSYRKFCRRN